MKPSKLESSESLEGHREVGNRYEIKDLKIEEKLLGIDTLEGLKRIREILKNERD